MKPKAKHAFIKLAAISTLSIGILTVLIVLGFAVFLTVTTKDFNLTKMVITDFFFFVISVAIFLFFFGIYEFLNSLIDFEKEIIHLEEDLNEKDIEIRELEQKIDHLPVQVPPPIPPAIPTTLPDQPFSNPSPDLLNGANHDQGTGN